MRRPATQSNTAPTGASTLDAVLLPFRVWQMAAFLGFVTVALYWPATSHEFVNYDDDVYVTENVHVQQGLTWENVEWAFVTPVIGNWHPVTMLSHMLDCQLFGLKPWGHHLTSVLLHALNTVLVFLFLRGLTGAFWRSALVSALFGWHPLHVESVAWVAERKDVLSSCFGLLALIFYSRYGQKRSRIERRELHAGSGSVALNPRSWALDYCMALLFFALGLMSKPMLVTWPFVLLLLDYWPLGRLKLSTRNPQFSTVWRLVWEKIPFFTLTVLCSVVTFVLQQRGSILTWGETLPLGARGGNALISYCRYLGKLFWPTDLAVFYPHPAYWPLLKVLLAGGMLVGITTFCCWQRRHPFLLMGWLWFVGTLVPVIQLVVESGAHAMADRYTYIPSLGVLLLVVWGGCELTKGWRYQVLSLSLAGSVALVACLALTWQQLGYWTDSTTLFRHALAVTENNWLAHNNLGVALGREGQTDEEIHQFQEAIRLNPNYAEAHNNLGIALEREGQTDEAIRQFQEAIRLNPNYAEAHNNLGVALGREGQTDEAIRQFQEAIRLNPNYGQAHNNLGVALGRKGELDEAIH